MVIRSDSIAVVEKVEDGASVVPGALDVVVTYLADVNSVVIGSDIVDNLVDVRSVVVGSVETVV